uniref:Mitochondrial fission regulator n=1 Tax=Acanthochromis polyacanthus TaxID=80966 RepID=A0A3Q1FVL7_9TELE
MSQRTNFPRLNHVPLITYRPHGYVDVTVETPAIPSFADVMWVFEDEGDSFAKTRNHLPPEKLGAASRDLLRRPAVAPRVQRGGPLRPAADPDALKKISALENELIKLRAQIAMIVTAAPEPQGSPPTPPVPTLTSTPRCVHLLWFCFRSPGGTPVRRRGSKGGPVLLSDPAALIAEALKRKFAQNRLNNSSDKENSVELSPFGSPETPKVIISTRFPQKRKHQEPQNPFGI